MSAAVEFFDQRVGVVTSASTNLLLIVVTYYSQGYYIHTATYNYDL